MEKLILNTKNITLGRNTTHVSGIFGKYMNCTVGNYTELQMIGHPLLTKNLCRGIIVIVAIIMHLSPCITFVTTKIITYWCLFEFK
jgi:hypothetical protein